MRSRVWGRIESNRPLIRFETVIGETPAATATSRRVTRPCGLPPARRMFLDLSADVLRMRSSPALAVRRLERRPLEHGAQKLPQALASRSCEQRFGLALFDDPAAIHEHHPV